MAQLKELAKKVADTLGQIEVLVINAGIAELKPVGAWDEAAYNRTFDINVRGAVLSKGVSSRRVEVRHELPAVVEILGLNRTGHCGGRSAERRAAASIRRCSCRREAP